MIRLFYRQLPIFLSVAAFTVLGSGLSAQPTIAGEIVHPGSLSEKMPSAPMPGTTATSAAALTQTRSLATRPAETSKAAEPQVAQIDVEPGQATRGGSSYVGVAGNVGLGGESALGDDLSFTVISKIGFTNSISARPSVVIDDDPVILIPITYDFSIRSEEAFDETLPIAPYIGAGIGISTGGDDDDDDDVEDVFDDDDDDDNDGDVGLLLTGGVDFPFSEQFTATAAVNVGFFDDTDVGLILGVGYNFTGF